MLIRIGSPDNARVRLVRKLMTRKGRTSEGKFTAEGINLLREAVHRGLAIEYVMVSDDYEGEPLLQDLKDSDNVMVCEVPSHIFNRLTDAEHGIGVISVIRIPENDIGMLDAIPGDSNVLVIDRVQDPGNMGTMIRTAAAAGYGMIIAVKGSADIWSHKVLRSTAGMIFDIPFAYADDAGTLADMLRSSGRRIAVTDPAGGRPYYEEDLKQGVALVIGNEGNGISDEIMALADIRVTIPMKGTVESLNAAVSAAILMYEAVRD